MKSKICIVKFGSTSLVGDEYVSVEARIQNICQQIQVIRESGWQPVIVTSGAKALGKARYSSTNPIKLLLPTVTGRTERIFVCNRPWLFRLLSPISAGAFAYSLPVTDNVFVANADLVHNVARSAAPDFNTRSFSAVAAHEITHGLIRHRVGLLHSLPTWVVEGYCDYVARESSFPEAEGLRLLNRLPALKLRETLIFQLGCS